MSFRKLLSYIRILFTAGFPLLYYHLFYLRRYAKHPEKYPLEKRYKIAQKLMSKIIRAYKVELHIDGLDKIEKISDKVLFISNHQSEIDPLIYVSIMTKPVTFAAKQEALDMPFVGTAFKAIEGVPLDRANIMNQLGEIKRIVSTIKSEDKPNIAIFAEGTRNRHPENNCMEFKGGSIKLGYMANVPIVPIALYGTFRIFSIKHYLRRYPVYIKFFDPISPSEYKQITSVDLADKFKKEIDENVNRFRLLDKKEIFAQRLTKKRKLFETINDKIPLES